MSGWIIGRDPVDGYVWLPAVTVVRGGGPERVVVDDPDPGYRPRPVGFVPTPRHRAPGPASTDDSVGGRHRAEARS